MWFFFFNDTATTEIYPLSLHDALPISTIARAISPSKSARSSGCTWCRNASYRLGNTPDEPPVRGVPAPDRKSTRLNSSHSQISYAVFCLKKKILLPPQGLRQLVRLSEG